MKSLPKLEKGDKIKLYGKNLEAIVVDILSHWSLKDYDWTGNVTYIAKLTNGQATNTFDVCKVTIVRNRITI